MSNKNGNAGTGEGVLSLLADRLVREAGITQEQAHELIKLIGTDWSSLLREAHILKERHRL
ncbi:MAG: hypothetical protein E5V75_01665 [Mesorhizobium sp.]|nr:MAG: hypothetical protein E5V75_01665 [Mesorhizobium sp.]